MDGSGSVSAATCQHAPCCLARLTGAVQQHDILSIVRDVLHCECCLNEFVVTVGTYHMGHNNS